MTRLIPLLVGTAILSLAPIFPAAAQGTQQTVFLTVIEAQKLSTGYRTSKVVGSSVMNEAGESIGSIDDLIITPDDKVPFAVLSVGGFLGIGRKYVVVSFASFEVKDKKMVLLGATKDSLNNLPEFVYKD